MRVVDCWTGCKADALRRAFRMTIEDFAAQLGVSPRAVAYWRQRPGMVQRPERQAILDIALDRAPDLVKARFSVLVTQDSAVVAVGTTGNVAGFAATPLYREGTLSDVSEIDAHDVIAWLDSTNTSDDAISYFAEIVARAAAEHASAPPTALVARVHQLHSIIRSLLRGGRQRQRQTVELLRLDADLLAHLCQLLGDVHRDRAASAYARASIALAGEAGAGSAAAFSAQAQIARWRGRYAEAADLAEQGSKANPPAPLRMLLAYQEANAAAVAGQPQRARAVLDTADAMDDSKVPYSAWSCPPARRALFRMAVAINLGDPDAALSHAAEAAPIWERERSRAFGTWAHFRIATAQAHMMLSSPEGAIHEIAPVLELPREFRISTVAEHLGTLGNLLSDQRFSHSPEVESWRERIRQFNGSTSESTPLGG